MNHRWIVESSPDSKLTFKNLNDHDPPEHTPRSVHAKTNINGEM
jgi:hypothetical protein